MNVAELMMLMKVVEGDMSRVVYDPMTFEPQIIGERNSYQAVYERPGSDTINYEKGLQAGNTCDRHQEGALNMSTSNNLFGAMMDPQRLMDRLFKKADNVVWDLMSGKTGVRTKDGIVTLNMEGTDPDYTFQTVENPFDSMGMAIPAFAQQTALDAVKIGDLILRSSGPAWVTKINKASVKVIKTNGEYGEFTPPKTQILDLGTGVMVVRSLFNALPNAQGGGLNSMVQTMMQMQMMSSMMGGDAGDMDGMMDMIVPMMLMQNGAGLTSGVDAQATAANPLAGMNIQAMLPMMMMGQMMKRRGGSSSGPVDRPHWNR